ncbi:MAG: hypothetical protein Q4F56_02950 [Candidatus Saccharibacteria bacterium]|nr:hypothetical protein [Candidatus Saccharibacteria bacterium]
MSNPENAPTPSESPDENIQNQDNTEHPESTQPQEPQPEETQENSGTPSNVQEIGQAAMSNPEAEPKPETESNPEFVHNKAELQKNKKIKKIALTLTLMALTDAAIFAFVGYAWSNSQKIKKNPQIIPPRKVEDAASLPDQTPYREETRDEFSQFEGVLSNGVYYNYDEYYEVNANKHSATLEMKSGKYGKDVSYIFDLPDSTPEQRQSKYQATRERIMLTAKEKPEALASYVADGFTEKEKASLGVQGMSALEIESYMSNPNNKYGGELQRTLLEKLQQALEDPNSSFDFYREYGREDTYYIGFHNLDGDEHITPNEMELCKESNRQRNGEPQVAWYRGEQRVLDLNMKCGLQPCYEAGQSDPDIPEIDDDQRDDDDDDDDGAGGNGDELEHKNERAEIEFGGPRVDRRDLDETVTPQTEEWEDRANFDLIESTRRQQAEIDAANQRIADEQAAAERRAAEEAAARRHAEVEQPQTEEDREQAHQADEALQNAYDEAARLQRQAAEAERARQAEAAARQAAQEAADRQAAENERQAAENARASAEDRSNLFESGDF